MYKTILVGTDGSATAAEAVDVAVRVAQPLGARLHILSVHADEAVAKQVVDDAVAQAERLGVDAVGHVRSGEPGRAVTALAGELGADLVVVGDRGMHGVNRLLSGTVPNHVAHNAPCSVLLVDSTRRAAG